MSSSVLKFALTKDLIMIASVLSGDSSSVQALVHNIGNDIAELHYPDAGKLVHRVAAGQWLLVSFANGRLFVASPTKTTIEVQFI